MTHPKIAVIFYSLYGHTVTLAETAVKAAKQDGAEVTLYQIPETLSENVLKAMSAAPRRTDVPTIAPDDLLKYDGYIFVIPTRYGRSVAQVSAFFDMTGGIWAKQSLAGKFATVMSSTGTQNGGQETTAFTTLPFFIHHGIIHVPMGYSFAKTLSMDEIKGGAPWGAGTLARTDGSRQPSVLELEETTHHAKHFTSVVAQYRRGGERLKGDNPVKEVKEEQATTSAKEQGEPERAKTSSAVSGAKDSHAHEASDGSVDGNGKLKKRRSVFKKIKDVFHKDKGSH